MLSALPSTPKDIGRRSIWKQTASYGRSNAFEATFGVQSFAFFLTTRLWKILEMSETTMRESRCGSSTSPCLTKRSSTEREAQMVMLTSSRDYHSRRLSTTAVVVAASPLSTMRLYTSSGLAA